MLILHAPGLHIGGGRQILAGLLPLLGGQDCVLLDARYPEADAQTSGRVMRVSPGLRGRIEGERLLIHLARATDIVLCVNGIPPIFRLPAKTVAFLQNRLLIDPNATRSLPLSFRRAVFRWGVRNTDLVVVQTSSMADLAAAAGFHNIMVAPLLENVPDDLPESARPPCDFFYPATGDTHKNHARLIAAWERLARADITPILGITLDAGHAHVWDLAERAMRSGARIFNYGWMSNNETLAVLKSARALIFPSLQESFGLPLMEAKMLGLPIIAAERDYVRDIVTPQETFDPQSEISISRAVARFLGRPAKAPQIHAPAAWMRLVAERAATV